VLVVLALLVTGLLITVDRVGAYAAEQTIADQTVKELNAREITSPRRPEVSLAGFPFLTQVVGGVYEKITIDVAEPQTEKVKLDHLTLVATDVRADAQAVVNGRGKVVAERVTGTATFSWDAVKQLVQLAGLPGVDPSSVDVSVVDNKVELRMPVQVGNTEVRLRASGTVVVEGGKVRIQLSDVGAEGQQTPAFVQSLLRQYGSRMTATVNVPALPYKLVINKVETTDRGVVVIASADQVTLGG
jgi:hypothetical protein